MEVACSQCIGCRLDHAGMWASRIEHESSLYDDSNGNCFITLTYDEEHLPQDWSLDKSHFQKFMKRLRKRYPQKIRYYHCGEYGENCRHGIHTTLCPGCNVGRPHYHAILFNIDFHDRVFGWSIKGNSALYIRYPHRDLGPRIYTSRRSHCSERGLRGSLRIKKRSQEHKRKTTIDQ